jgi:hypothetical protein
MSKFTSSKGNRVWETPLVDKGFASVRKIGNGLYATSTALQKGAVLSGPTGCCYK